MLTLLHVSDHYFITFSVRLGILEIFGFVSCVSLFLRFLKDTVFWTYCMILTFVLFTVTRFGLWAWTCLNLKQI